MEYEGFFIGESTSASDSQKSKRKLGEEGSEIGNAPQAPTSAGRSIMEEYIRMHFNPPHPMDAVHAQVCKLC
jgi:hypothetical protein